MFRFALKLKDYLFMGTSPLITYETYLEEGLSYEDVQDEDFYVKVFYESGRVQKKESYRRGKLSSLEWFLDADYIDDYFWQRLIAEFKVEVSIVFRSFSKGYRIERRETYRPDGTKWNSYEIEVYNEENQLIYEKEVKEYERYDEIEIVKFCYHQKDDYHRFRFEYNKKGELSSVEGCEGPLNYSKWNTVSAKEFEEYYPDFLKDNPYYRTNVMLPRV